MEKFEINILGCGSALPTTRHYSSSQVLNIREKLYMIDCGEATQMQLRRSKLKFSRLNHIFISHLHGDHCFGLIGLISTFGLLGRTASLHIYAQKDLETILKPQIEYFCKGITYEVVFHTIDPTKHEMIHEDRSVEVYSLPLKHRVPCCGFLFKEKPTLPNIKRDMIDAYNIPTFMIPRIKAGENYITNDGDVVPNARLVIPAPQPRKYAYCSDTMYIPDTLVPQIMDCDLLFHEATFANDNLPRAKETCHSTAEQAADIAKQSRARKLLIGHFSARYEDESVLLKEAQKIFMNTELSRENMVVKL